MYSMVYFIGSVRFVCLSLGEHEQEMAGKQVRALGNSTQMLALEDNEQVQALEDGAQVQVLEEGKQVLLA